MVPDADLLAKLRPPRLPDGSPSLSVQIVLAAFALGIVAAMIVVPLLGLASERRKSRAATLGEELARARELPVQERLACQARLLRSVNATGRGERTRWEGDALYGRVRTALYRPASPDLCEDADLDAIDTAILALAEETRRASRRRIVHRTMRPFMAVLGRSRGKVMRAEVGE